MTFCTVGTPKGVPPDPAIGPPRIGGVAIVTVGGEADPTLILMTLHARGLKMFSSQSPGRLVVIEAHPSKTVGSMASGAVFGKFALVRIYMAPTASVRDPDLVRPMTSIAG